MPNKPKHPCVYPGCPETTNQGAYCPLHAKQIKANYEKTRETATARGYDTRWARLRKMTLARHPMCQCSQCKGHDKAANLIHHDNGNPKDNREVNLIAYNDNCHNKQHMKQGDRW